MLAYLLHGIVPYPELSYLLNYGVYYPIILIAFVVGVRGIYVRLIKFGHPVSRVRLFLGLLLIVTYPAAILSARAANMFYYPSHYWSFSFFIDQLVSGRFVTFHAGLFLPFIIIVVMIKAFKWDVLPTLDTFFLYIPLGHAIGRVGCLLVGCCWGGRLTCSIGSAHFAFDNPVPLYAILLNTGIFLILRYFYTAIYDKQRFPHYRGIVIALYLLLYGNVRLVLEVFRKEIKVAGGLTQAQIVMMTFIAIGTIIFGLITLKALRSREQTEDEAGRKERRLKLSIAGFVLFILGFAYLAWYLLINHYVSWPFHRVTGSIEAYQSIYEYAPVLVLAAVSLIWLRANSIAIAPLFRWKGFSQLFLLIMIGSAAYVVYVLYPLRFGIYSPCLWPPVIILSLLNAVSEEVIFRVAFYRLLRTARAHPLLANVLQAALYASFHIFIGGPVFGAFAFVYGLALGYLLENSESALPGIICHLIIDLGAIGAPILAS